MEHSVSTILYQARDKNEFQVVYRCDTTVVVTLRTADEILSGKADINHIKDSDKSSVLFINPVSQQNESCYELIIKKILSLTCKVNVSISYLCFEELSLLCVLEALKAVLLYAEIIEDNQITFELNNRKRILVNQDIIYEEESSFC